MNQVMGMLGLRHLALRVRDVDRSRKFYEQLCGMKIVWQPDAENVYLSSGQDNLALHQVSKDRAGSLATGERQPLDHFGFIMESPTAVDQMFQRAGQAGTTIIKPPKQHRDGSYSFYMTDPDGNVIQVLYEPNIVKKC
ncbi:MAG: VOC family protein [Nitrospirales bacterium]